MSPVVDKLQIGESQSVWEHYSVARHDESNFLLTSTNTGAPVLCKSTQTLPSGFRCSIRKVPWFPDWDRHQPRTEKASYAVDQSDVCLMDIVTAEELASAPSLLANGLGVLTASESHILGESSAHTLLWDSRLIMSR